VALSTYSELQESLSAWLDSADLDGREADFIALAEDEIGARLLAGLNEGRMIRPMVTRSALTIDDEYVDLPDGNMALPISIEVTSHSEPWTIDYLSPEDFLQLKVEIGSDPDTSVPPVRFTVLNDELRFWPAPATSWTAEFTRFDNVPALSDTNTSNWVLANHRNAYLAASLIQAMLFGWENPTKVDWDTRFETAMSGLLARYPVQSSQAKLRSETALLGRNAGNRLTLSGFMSGQF